MRSGELDRGTSTRNTVPVPGRVVTISGWPSSPQMRLTIDRPQAEARAAVLGLRTFAPIELLEDTVQLALLDAWTGVPDFQADQSIARARREQHPALLRIPDRVGQQVSNHPLQQQRVAVDRNAAAPDAQ